MNLSLNEDQKTLYYIAENMKMEKSISKEGYDDFQRAIKLLGLIPNDATNGDVITNIFSTAEVRYPNEDFVELTLDGIIGITVERKWWDSQYTLNDKVEEKDNMER